MAVTAVLTGEAGGCYLSREPMSPVSFRALVVRRVYQAPGELSLIQLVYPTGMYGKNGSCHSSHLWLVASPWCSVQVCLLFMYVCVCVNDSLTASHLDIFSSSSSLSRRLCQLSTMISPGNFLCRHSLCHLPTAFVFRIR